MKRIVAVQGDARAACGRRAPLSIGIARWRGAPGAMALVVKMTASIGGDETMTVVEPAAVGGEVASDLDEAHIAAPTDFVLHKPWCDVMLVGHAHSPEPAERIAVELRIGDKWVRTTCVAKGARALIPLLPVYLEDRDRLETVGPVSLARERQEDDFRSFDFSRFQAASEAMRINALPPDAHLSLVGLSPDAPSRTASLPGLAPRAFLDSRRHRIGELDMQCDTLLIDTDLQTATLTWRALLPPSEADDDIDRVIVVLEDASNERERDDVFRTLPRGTIGFAIEEGGAPEGDLDELEMARYEVLEHAAEPELDLDRYAVICAELAEGRPPREDVLSRHDYDERRWLIEERAWTDRMASEADRGDGRLTAEFADRFVAAQLALAAPEEPRPLAAYAAVKRAYVRAHDPSKVLDAHRITRGEWMRLDRHWRERAASDRAVAGELSQLLSRDAT